MELFTRHKVYTEVELRARHEIKLEGYCKVLHIEGRTMIDMVWKDILPAMSAYSKTLTETALAKRSLDEDIDISYEKDQVRNISALINHAKDQARTLKAAIDTAETLGDSLKTACFYRDAVIPAMNALRVTVDAMETLSSKAAWPYPSYGDLLFSVK